MKKLMLAVAAATVMLGLVTLASWLLALALPRLAEQASNFAVAAPDALASTRCASVASARRPAARATTGSAWMAA